MAAVRLSELVQFLQTLAPLDMAEEWDNVGLLLGDDSAEVRSVMTCLTLSPDVAAEAVREQVQLVVTHHPILFRAVKRIVRSSSEGRMLLELIRHGVHVYSPHTGYDSAAEGINFQLARHLGLSDVQPIRPLPESPQRGSGRCGTLPVPVSLRELNDRLREQLQLPQVQYVGEPEQSIRKIGIACGAGADFLRDADRLGCEALVTGEARFHDCLEARSRGLALVLIGHYASERHAMEELATILQARFPALTIFASRDERDPVRCQ